MKKTLSIVLLVLLVFLAVACNNTPEVHTVHTWDEGKQTLAPTCTVAGTWTKTCTVCGITKDEPIEATGHVHANLAKGIISDADHVNVEVTCVTDGEYYYRCDVCDSVFKKTVTPKEAAAAKMDVPHVVSVEGKYVPYVKTNAWNTDLNGLAEDKLADYSDSQVIAATEFEPAYKIALCKSCGVALEGVAQEKLMTAKSTASSDYKSVVGNWVYKKVDTTDTNTKGDYLELNAIVSVTGNVYSAEVYAVKYDADANKTVTEKATCSSVTLNSASTPRTLTLVLTGLTSATDTSLNNNIVLSGDKSGYTVSINASPVEMGKQTGYTATLTKSESHTKHNFSVMDNYGLKTFNIHASAGATSDSNLTPGHYLACDGCDVKYLAEQCYYMDNTTKTPLTEGTDKTCAACGYKGTTGEYLYLMVTDSTSKDYYLVAKNSVLPFGSETYAFFNGLEKEIEAWTKIDKVNVNGSGFVMTTADDASLTFTAKSST